MIERVFYDGQGNELLNLWRWTREQKIFVRPDNLPDLAPIGTFEEVPGTGQKIFVGDRRPRAGQLTVSIGTYGRDHEVAFALQREIVNLLPHVRAYSRIPGGTLSIAGYSSVKRTFAGSAQFVGTVDVTLECASPYFWADAAPQVLSAGANTVQVSGMASTGLRLELTAGSSVTNPQIVSDAGVTTWRGTVPAGQTLILDSRDGWDVRLGTLDVSLYITGPLPSLEPGTRTLSVPMAGQVYWREGEL